MLLALGLDSDIEGSVWAVPKAGHTVRALKDHLGLVNSVVPGGAVAGTVDALHGKLGGGTGFEALVVHRVLLVHAEWCRGWGEHTVDDVYNTVGRTNICLDDLGVLDCDRPINLVNVKLLSLEGLDILGWLQILCANSGSRNHMVLED